MSQLSYQDGHHPFGQLPQVGTATAWHEQLERRRHQRTKTKIRTALRRAMSSYWNAPVQFGYFLRSLGKPVWAERFLSTAFEANPYDIALGELLCDIAFDNRIVRHALKTSERGSIILAVLNGTFPSERVIEAYFENLSVLMRPCTQRSFPGLIVLGLGTGRVGSTSLSAMIATNSKVLATHENPVCIWWTPHPRQIDFHLRRFRLLTQYYPVVFDWAHWWLNAGDAVFGAFPTSKAIGIHRDVDATVQSLLRVESKRDNIVASMHNKLWGISQWNPMRPDYPVPEDVGGDRERARELMVRRYVNEYNSKMTALAERLPGRVLLLHTEELDDPSTGRKVSDFVDLEIKLPTMRRNVGDRENSRSQLWWL